MHIHGLQKLAMVDYPGKLAATVFTGGCNLRCPFCHNALLVTRLAETPEIPEQEVLDFLASRRGLLDGVVLTGGEPLLQPDAAPYVFSAFPRNDEGEALDLFNVPQMRVHFAFPFKVSEWAILRKVKERPE